MAFSYPENKILPLLVVAIFVCGSAQAQQQGTYASARTSISSQATHLPSKAQAVVRIVSRSERKTTLSWQAFSGEVSHYVLERSVDGRHYGEVCVFFTSGMENEPQYHYTDQLRNSYHGPLFYRLRVVGLDGSEMYTLPSLSGAQR